jgi:hypothetical protein
MSNRLGVEDAITPARREDGHNGHREEVMSNMSNETQATKTETAIAVFSIGEYLEREDEQAIVGFITEGPETHAYKEDDHVVVLSSKPLSEQERIEALQENEWVMMKFELKDGTHPLDAWFGMYLGRDDVDRLAKRDGVSLPEQWWETPEPEKLTPEEKKERAQKALNTAVIFTGADAARVLRKLINNPAAAVQFRQEVEKYLIAQVEEEMTQPSSHAGSWDRSTRAVLLRWMNVIPKELAGRLEKLSANGTGVSR